MATTSTSSPSTGAARGPGRSVGMNHLVLNVRDIEASHRFWTEIMGWEQCGQIDPSRRIMRFYRATPDSHHDLALVQLNDPAGAPPVPRWSMEGRQAGVNHIAITYPTREDFLQQLEHLRTHDVEFLVRGDHGMTHSVYIADPDGNGIEVLYELPAEVWEGDVNGALNWFRPLPLDGPESMQDSTDYQRFGSGN